MDINQRHHIRVDYRQVIHLKTSTGLQLVAETNNISVAGIGIICDRPTAGCIVPGGHHFNLNQAASLMVEFRLGDSSQSICAACKVCNVHRLAEDSYGLNLEFIELNTPDKQCLDDFVSQQSS